MSANKTQAAECKVAAIAVFLDEIRDCISKARTAIGAGDYSAAAVALMHAEDPLDAVEAYVPTVRHDMRRAAMRSREKAFAVPPEGTA